MARRSKGHSTGGRGHINPVRYRAPVVPLPTPIRLSPPPTFIAGLEDRRLFHPDRLPAADRRPPLAWPRAAARVIPRPGRSTRPPYSIRPGKLTLAFQVPERVSMCAKRQIRRQVLFAKRKGGRNGMRRSRRNFWSQISCRRK